MYHLDVIGPDDIDWIEFTPGNLVKPLRVWPDGRYTMLAKMMEGAQEPRHRHIGSINMYVLSGHGADINGVSPGPGSWIYERDGAVHDAFTCTSESVVLVMGNAGCGVAQLDDSDNVIATYSGAEIVHFLPDDVRKLIQQD